MKRKTHDHVWHYAILLLILIAGFIIFNSFVGNTTYQFFTGILVGVSYIFWGVLHHMYHGDFNWKIMVEYTALAVFAVSLLGAFLFL